MGRDCLVARVEMLRVNLDDVYVTRGYVAPALNTLQARDLAIEATASHAFRHPNMDSTMVERLADFTRHSWDSRAHDRRIPVVRGACFDLKHAP